MKQKKQDKSEDKLISDAETYLRLSMDRFKRRIGRIVIDSGNPIAWFALPPETIYELLATLWPRDRNKRKTLREAGYTFVCTSTCRDCGAEIHWCFWIWKMATDDTPRSKLMPLDADLTPHWSTCPKAYQFKKTQ